MPSPLMQLLPFVYWLVLTTFGILIFLTKKKQVEWNDGICRKTGEPWAFYGFVSCMGYKRYLGGVHQGTLQVHWTRN